MSNVEPDKMISLIKLQHNLSTSTSFQAIQNVFDGIQVEPNSNEETTLQQIQSSIANQLTSLESTIFQTIHKQIDNLSAKTLAQIASKATKLDIDRPEDSNPPSEQIEEEKEENDSDIDMDNIFPIEDLPEDLLSKTFSFLPRKINHSILQLVNRHFFLISRKPASCHFTAAKRPDLTLNFCDFLEKDKFQPKYFLPYRNITRLEIELHEAPIPSMQHISKLSLLPKIFPNVTNLVFENCGFCAPYGYDKHLDIFPKLRKLEISMAWEQPDDELVNTGFLEMLRYIKKYRSHSMPFGTYSCERVDY